MLPQRLISTIDFVGLKFNCDTPNQSHVFDRVAYISVAIDLCVHKFLWLALRGRGHQHDSCNNHSMTNIA